MPSHSRCRWDGFVLAVRSLLMMRHPLQQTPVRVRRRRARFALLAVLVWSLACAAPAAGQGRGKEKGKGKCKLQSVMVTQLTDLRYGTVIQGQGAVTKQVTDPMIASFQARGPRVNSRIRYLVVAVESPGALAGVDPSNSGGNIPYDVAAAYTKGRNDPSASTAMACNANGCAAFYEVRARRDAGDKCFDHYYYVFGTITIGNQPPGIYRGMITLSVTYLTF